MVSPRALANALAGSSRLSMPSERISNLSTIPGTPFFEDPGAPVAAVQSLNISITNDEECDPSRLTYRLVVPQQYVSPDNFYELQMAALYYIVDPKQPDPIKRYNDSYAYEVYSNQTFYDTAAPNRTVQANQTVFEPTVWSPQVPYTGVESQGQNVTLSDGTMSVTLNDTLLVIARIKNNVNFTDPTDEGDPGSKFFYWTPSTSCLHKLQEGLPLRTDSSSITLPSLSLTSALVGLSLLISS
ncbi:hypothetical protein FA10DRAFT_277985 [Acaromyces ingoldii]|uniref:Uncharacterized protein n=1 Tax=Acaromyces ingoldii TaxID=215250 RepID=A0A316YNW4_9BASI|nr:hypothetical protein FA10DRAFT_277985 [Acaromyces ingoldii]PWN91067.1 hypothetical protein FA10DRAFT_277985 [Acaromyces ingoldii]